MRAWLVLLLVIPLAGASPGHGDLPTDTTLFLHHLPDGIAVHPSVPTGAALAPADDVALCDSAATWTAVFTQELGTWTTGLARAADLDGALRLTWYFETVEPGSDTPAELPLGELRLQATLRAGDAPDAIGAGEILASGFSDARPTPVEIGDRYVYEMTTAVPFADAPVIPTDGFHMEIALDTSHGVPADVCRMAPIGVRAYDGEVHSRLSGAMYDAVAIDRIDAIVNDGVTIQVHASSPWGRFDIVTPDAPRLIGPTGEVDLGQGTMLANATGLSMAWPLEGAANGTYRIDATVRNLQGTEVAESLVFKIGGEAPPEPAIEAPVEKESPGVPALAILGLFGCIALFARRGQ